MILGFRWILRDQRIAELELEVAEVAALRTENAALRKELEAIKARLGLNSSNSSKPPSSDPPHAAGGKPRKKGRKRKRGGQKGHPRHERSLIPPERVTITVEHRPDECAHCSEDLGLDDGDPNPKLHQIVELPKIEPDVTEHQCFSATCGNCGEATEAVLPEDVQRDTFGPRLKALVGMLSGKYRISKRGMVELLSDLLHIDVALGSISKMEQFVSDAMATPHEQVRVHVHSSNRAHADETGWRQNKKKAWLWVASTVHAVLFSIAVGRGKKPAQVLLGKDYVGTKRSRLRRERCC
jgi:transposase